MPPEVYGRGPTASFKALHGLGPLVTEWDDDVEKTEEAEDVE